MQSRDNPNPVTYPLNLRGFVVVGAVFPLHRVTMTTGCKIYSTEHAEPLHRAQTALARLNLVSITILEKLTC